MENSSSFLLATLFCCLALPLVICAQTTTDFKLLDSVPVENQAASNLGPADLTYSVVPTLCTTDDNGNIDSCVFAFFSAPDSGPAIFDELPNSIGLDLSELFESGAGSPILVNESLQTLTAETSQISVSIEATGDFSITPSGFFVGGEVLHHFQLQIGQPGQSLPPVADSPVNVLSAIFVLSDADGETLEIMDLPEASFNDDTPDGWAGDFGIVFSYARLADLVFGMELVVTFESKNDFICGDVNRDGVVTLLDVQPFVDLIISNEFQIEADINGDGSVDLLDIVGFVSKLAA